MTETTETVWMTRTEASKAMGVCLRTIHRYMVAGKLPYTRDVRTGRVLVKVSSVKSDVQADLLG